MKTSLLIKQSIYSIVLVVFMLSCSRVDEFPVGKSITCDAEILNAKGDKFVAVNDSTSFFDGGRQRTDNEAFSGKHSVMTIPKKSAFALAHRIKRADPDQYFVLSVWRKSKDGKGVLVASGKKSKSLYEATSEPVERREDGWEKLVLEVYTPPNFGNQEVKFYVWNNGSDTAYFDDFVIEHRKQKQYPTYTEEPLIIALDTSTVIKIAEKRKQAFENGILETSDNDWVKGFIFSNNKPMKARFRLKGDWLDHLQGDKWSFRIKMRKKFSWNRMVAFSVQTPSSRDFLLEWVAHQLYADRDMLTTRYGFIPVYFDNEPRGIYAWEEHFTKQLLEFNNRREGPIIKFSEDAFWQMQKIYIQTENWQQLPFYEAAVIKPFGEGRTMASPVLYAQFLNGQKLLHQYKHGLAQPSQIFDIEKLANYYAMLELTQARHGMFWHNQRYYYNPVIDKLEPIAFDGYSFNAEIDVSMEENFLYQIYIMEEAKPDEQIFTDLFYDETFLKHYFEKLGEVTDPEYIDEITKQISAEQHHYDSLIKMEFPMYYFDEYFIAKSAESIRNYLPYLQKMAYDKLASGNIHFEKEVMDYSDTSIFQNTPELYVNAFREALIDDSIAIRIHNYFPGKISILGTGINDKFISNFDIDQKKIQAFTGGAEGVEISMTVDSSSRYLFFLAGKRFDTFVVPINPWPYPDGLTARQELLANADISNYSFLDRLPGNELVFKTGEYQIDQPVVIPEGYKVIFEKGTKIDFINRALLLSFSPVFIRGTRNDPVIIGSSDFSANAFTVLQAEGESVLEHVVFENLNTLNIDGWQHTGAVTFYESDVTISNALFYRNQCEDALNIIRSDFVLKNSKFDYIFSDAFDSDFSTGKVINTGFVRIGNDAIDFSGSEISISGVNISEVGDKGISGGEDSKLFVENTTIERSHIGIASKDLSIVRISDSYVGDCEYGLLLLQKKPEYGPAIMDLINTQIVNPKTKMLIEKGSKVVIDGDTIVGTEKKLGELFY